MKVRVLATITALALLALLLNSLVPHFQGGEVYEAANLGQNLLTKGFNVTVRVETVEGRVIEGTLLSVRGSTLTIVVNGTTYTVGGPQATREDLKARRIELLYRGLVYVYSVSPLEGKARDVFSTLIPEQYYSVRYSGIIYLDCPISVTELGRLKYRADYLNYGSITINQLSSTGAIITANMVPVQYLMALDCPIYTYGTLYVNSEERNLPLRLLEVRAP